MPKKTFLVRIIVSLFLLFVCFEHSFTLEISNDKEGSGSSSIICSGDRIEYYEQANKVVGEGDVVIKYKGDKLTCDKITIFTETKDAICEGNVRFYQGKSVFSGNRFSYNFETRKGTILDARAMSMPVHGKGKTIEKVQARRFTIRDGYITTCEYEKPHYKIRGKEIELLLEDKLVVRNAVYYLGRYPLMYFPYYSYPLREDRPRVTIVPGHSKAWGVYALTYWRYYFTDDSRGYIRLDYREKMDFASGFDYDFKHPILGEGELNVYYMNEREIADHIYTNPRELVQERERFAVDFKDRIEHDKNTLTLIEYHKYKDTNFRKDYFYKEYETLKKTPESYISYTKDYTNHSFNFYAQKRMNRFWSETEVMPEVRYNLRNQRLWNSKFYLEGDYSATHYNRKSALAVSDDQNDKRLDIFNKLSYPTKLPGKFRFLSFTPYVGTRQTLYSRNLDGSERYFIRGIPYYGWDLTTKFSRVFLTQGEFLGVKINKLRHVITPSINQDYIWNPTVPSYKLAGLGGADSTTFSNVVTFSIDQRLQTKWPRVDEDPLETDLNIREDFVTQEEEDEEDESPDGDKPGEAEEVDDDLEIIDLINWLTTVSFYPHEFFAGVHANRKDFSNINSKIEIRPKRWMQITADTSYNKYSRDFETFNLEYTIKKKDKWQLDLAHRYQQNSLGEITGRLNWVMNPKWCIGVYERFDLKAFDHGFKKINDLKTQEYSLIRDMHCWTAELSYRNTRGYGSEIWLVFRLKANPDVPVEWSTSFDERKAGSQWFETSAR